MNDEQDNEDSISGAAIWLLLILATLCALAIGMICVAGIDKLVGA